jgi:DNA-directed RNA polymerase sigma subunit (sigma70/sigma32)
VDTTLNEAPSADLASTRTARTLRPYPLRSMQDSSKSAQDGSDDDGLLDFIEAARTTPALGDAEMLDVLRTWEMDERQVLRFIEGQAQRIVDQALATGRTGAQLRDLIDAGMKAAGRALARFPSTRTVASLPRFRAYTDYRIAEAINATLRGETPEE